MTIVTDTPTTPLVVGDSKLPPPTPISFEDYMDWMDEDTHAEWVDGEIIMASPARIDHQDIRDFLLKLMGLYVETHGLGKVVSAPFVMYLPTRPSGREPDLLFIKSEHLDRLHRTKFHGPPDLVVEVTSPESDARDRGEKFVEYEGAGIPEYWLIDPIRQQAMFFQLDEQGRYCAAPVNEDGNYYAAALPGFWFHVAWLWQQPLPESVWSLVQTGGVEQARALLRALQSTMGREQLRDLLDEAEGAE